MNPGFVHSDQVVSGPKRSVGGRSLFKAAWVERRGRMLARAATLGLAVLIQANDQPAWPQPEDVAGQLRPQLATLALPLGALRPTAPHLAIADSPDIAAIRRQPVCIVSTGEFFGKLGSSLLFVHERRGTELRVGYFAHWSTERPWGDNTLTHTLLPALVIDATYSHFAFVLPGIQYFLYGAGDIEGALIRYQVSASGELNVQSGLADDEHHADVALQPSDLRAADGRIALLTSVWSHQLGAHGAAQHLDHPSSAQITCFGAQAIRPLTEDTTRRFRLGTPQKPLRARPAWRALQ